MFKTTDANGFHMTFANGYTVSVQWNPGNYVSDRGGERGCHRESNNAEVAAWGSDGSWVRLGDCDDVVGWQSADDVARIMTMVAGLGEVK